MNSSTREAFLELFDFEKKNVFCAFIDLHYLNGLLKRGANLYLNKVHANSIEWKKKFSNDDLCNVHFIDSEINLDLDFRILKLSQYKNFSRQNNFAASETIILDENKFSLNYFLSFPRRRFKEKAFIIYSVVPSFSKIRLILPEEKDIDFERYWRLKAPSLFLTLKLVVEWFFIKNRVLRKIFSDKLIVIK